MFENPPAWTAPLANLTDWFDWDALAAIGTVAALWFALWQAGKADRLARDRARELVLYYADLAEGVVRIVRGMTELFERSSDPRRAKTGLRVNANAALREFEALTTQDLAGTDTRLDVLAVRMKLTGLVAFVEEMQAGDDAGRVHGILSVYERGLREDVARLRWKAERLGEGRIEARLHDLGRKLTHGSPPRTSGPTGGTAGPGSPEGTA